MLRDVRRSLGGGLLALSLLITGANAQTAGALDTRALPRLDGAMDALPPTAELTAFDLPSPAVEARLQAVLTRLTADGWRLHGQPNTALPNGPTTYVRLLKKGAQGLRVTVAFASREALATRITYEARTLAFDFPFPDGAPKVDFDSEKGFLIAMVPAPAEAVEPEMRQRMLTTGWVATSATTRPGSIVYRWPDGRLVRLSVAKRVDGTSTVTINAVEPSAPRTAESSPSRAPSSAAEMRDLLDTAKQMMAEVDKIAPRPRAEKKEPPQPQPGEAPLEPASETSGAPIAVPATAENVAFDAARGELTFRSRSSLHALSAFYRREMQRAGWREQRTVIESADMVSLNFEQGRNKSVSFTLMARNDHATVRARGTGLVTASAAASPASNRPSSAAPAVTAPAPASPPREQVTLDALKAEDRGGLPVPAPNQNFGSERTPYRQDVTAQVPASVADVLAFYRQVLTARGWTEAAGTEASETAARAEFTTPDGPASLGLARDAASGLTRSRLTLLREAKARADGILPPPGRAMLVFGNIEEAAVTFRIGQQTLKVGAGVGSQDPNGPKLVVAPGRHTVTIQFGRQSPKSETVEVEAGRAWGLLAGQRGVLALPVY